MHVNKPCLIARQSDLAQREAETAVVVANRKPHDYRPPGRALAARGICHGMSNKSSNSTDVLAAQKTAVRAPGTPGSFFPWVIPVDPSSKAERTERRNVCPPALESYPSPRLRVSLRQAQTVCSHDPTMRNNPPSAAIQHSSESSSCGSIL